MSLILNSLKILFKTYLLCVLPTAILLTENPKTKSDVKSYYCLTKVFNEVIKQSQ